MKDSEVSKAIRTEEYIDNCCDDGEPNAPELSWDEALPNVKDAVNPEKLASNQQHEDGEEKKAGSFADR